MVIIRLLLIMLASCIVYITCYVFVVDKPITIGIKQDYFARKTAYLASLHSPKIVLLAGSNGRFSHRCETIEQETGIGCANMSIEAGMSLGYQFGNIKPYLARGDLVYLPLEYAQYRRSKLQVMAGEDAPYIAAYDKNYLLKLNMEHLLHTLFYADLRYFLSAIGEMLMNNMNVQQRYSVDDLTTQGDESGHAGTKAARYSELIKNTSWNRPAASDFQASSYGTRTLVEFMDWASSKGILVVGGLPTTFMDEPLPDDLVHSICMFYRSRGQAFIKLENNSQYPREQFFDSPNHLQEPYQIAHSQKLAPLLRALIEDPDSRRDTCDEQG